MRVRQLAVGLVVLGLIAGGARAALLQGTSRADRIVGTPQPDQAFGRGGDDRITTAWDDQRDVVHCGAGNDLVNADLRDVVAADCETVAVRVSRDTTTDYYAQHETQVEPDSFAWGKTIVTSFQNGRIANGGAAALGWATSLDGGLRWRAGNLPQGPYRIVSDPVVAYDAEHGWWLVAGLGAGSGLLDIYVVRSRDGLSWSSPVRAAGDVDEDYDKEWLACDNGARSKFRGSCYLAYVDIRTHWLAIRVSRDGGLTWSKQSKIQPGIAGATFSGPMPVVQPDGDVVVPYVLYAPIDDGEDRMAAVISRDGGSTWSAPVRIAGLSYEEPFELRAPTMPSVDADAAGRLYMVWSDSRFRDDGTSMDVVLSTSTNGTAWSEPRQISGTGAAGVAFVPAVGVDPTTSAAKARIAVAYYTLRMRAGCALFVPGCSEQVDAWLIQSKNGGETWTRPRRLNTEPMALTWLADTTLGRMLGDYISVSWSAGKPVAVLSLAGEPGYALSQAIFTARTAS